MSSKVVETILRFIADETAARKTIRVSESVREALGKTAKQTLDIDAAASKMNAEFAEMARARAISILSAQAIEAAQETGDWATQLKRVATELSNIGASDDEIRRVAQSIGEAQTARIAVQDTRAVGNRNNVTIDRLGSVGSQLFSGLGSGELANAAGLVGDIAGAAGSLGAVGIAGAALTPVLAAVTAKIQENIQRETERLNILKQVAVTITTGTRNEVKARIEALQDDINATQFYIRSVEQRTGRSAEYLAQLNDISGANLSAGASVLQLYELYGNNLVAAAADIDNANTSIENNQFWIQALEQALKDNATAANDAAAAERELQAARDQIFDGVKAAGQIWYDQAQLLASIDDMTLDQRRSRAAELARQIASLQGQYEDYLASQTTAGGYAAYLLGQQIDKLRLEFELLSRSATTTADALANASARTKALSEQADRYFDALKREGDARDELLKAQQELTEADTKAAAEAAKAAAEAETRRTEILAEGSEQREDLERKTQDALRKIGRDYARSQFQAVAERDAVAAKQAEIQRADALDDQKESDDEAQRRLDQAQQKQLRSLEKSLQDQGLRLAEAQQRERDTKQRAYLQAQNDLINAENATRSIQTTAIQGRVIREGNAYQQISSLVDFYMTAIVNRFTAGLQSMLGAVPGSPAAWDFYGMSAAGSGGSLGQMIDSRVDSRMAAAFRAAHR